VRGAELVFPRRRKIVARNALEFMATTGDGTANVLEAAQEHGVTRFVLVSSLAAAGRRPRVNPIDETRPRRSGDRHYGRFEARAEVLVRDALSVDDRATRRSCTAEWDAAP